MTLFADPHEHRARGALELEPQYDRPRLTTLHARVGEQEHRPARLFGTKHEAPDEERAAGPARARPRCADRVDVHDDHFEPPRSNHLRRDASEILA